MRAADERGELCVDTNAASNQVLSSITGTQLVSEVLANRSDIVSRFHDMWIVLLPGIVRAEHRLELDLRPPAERN